MRSVLLICAAAALAGCVKTQNARDAGISREVERTIKDTDARTRASRTISALARLEEALKAYVSAERAVPETLDLLVPKYLGEMPSVELDIRGHRETAQVEMYDPSVLRDGQIDGSRLKDTGRWGYVRSDRQVVIFVDCTHQSTRRKPWYQERGL